MSKASVVAANFVARHGVDGLRRLVDMLQEERSGQEIADSFGVSRERVRQWKNAFGHSVVIYQVHPDVQRLLA